MMRYQYCPKCGGKLSLNENRDISKPECTSCGCIFYQNPTAGVMGILIRDGKVLLGRRCRGNFKGRWCFPGGSVDWDEDVYEAVRREFLEETGLKIDITAVYTVLSNYGEQFVEWRRLHNFEQQHVIIWFLAKELGGKLNAGDDIDEVGFFSSNELPEIAFPVHEIVLKKLQNEHLIS
jgi:8-oxo-dGTP diphosphatase